MPNLHISRDHGRARRVRLQTREFLVLPLYHPAAALYNGSMRSVLLADFATVPALVAKLTDGADSFIMNYGNSGLNIVNKDGHRIYIYRKMGIAIFDDNSDDSIDMYLIFPPEK